jgi:hypothetical protein
MAKIDTERSYLQRFSDKAMKTAKSTGGVSVNLPNKKYTILDRNPNTQTQKTLMDKPFSPQNLFMVKKIEEASKKYDPYPDQSKLDDLIKQRYPTGLSTPTVTGTGTATVTGAKKDTDTEAEKKAATVTPTVTGKPVDVENEIKYLKGILDNPDSTDAAKAFAIKEGKRLYGTDITKKTTEQLDKEASGAQEAFINADVTRNITGLTAAQEQALATIEGQRAGIAPQFQDLRSQASTTSMQQARNFAEYMGARGASMGGTSAQAEIQRGAQLQGQFGQIGLAEQNAIQGLENKKTEVTLDFESKISQAKTKGEADIARFQLEQTLANIAKIEAKAAQEIQNAQELEKIKIEEAAKSSESLLDFEREKELIKFQANESIRKSTADAKLKADQATTDFERKGTEEKEVNYQKDPQFLAYLNEFDTDVSTPSTTGKANLLAETFLDESGKNLNSKARNTINNIRTEFGDAAATKALRNLEKLLNIQPQFNLS